MISPINASCLLHQCLERMFRAIAKNIIICEKGQKYANFIALKGKYNDF